MLKNNSHHIFTQTNLQKLENPINCDLLLANCSYASISKQKNVLSQTVFRVNRSKGLMGGARKTTFVPTCHHEVACSGCLAVLHGNFPGEATRLQQFQCWLLILPLPSWTCGRKTVEKQWLVNTKQLSVSPRRRRDLHFSFFLLEGSLRYSLGQNFGCKTPYIWKTCLFFSIYFKNLWIKVNYAAIKFEKSINRK